jgi:2-keto-4-pentenoate hydratase
MDQGAIAQAAAMIVAARRTGKHIDALPAACQPQTLDDAFAIQDAVIAALGETIAGWKVALVDGRVVRGPIFASRVFDSGAKIEAAKMPLLGIEGEIAFLFNRDMPAGKYSYEDVAAAVTAFAAIEVVDSRFATYPDAPPQAKNADFVSNGGFVRGPSAANWRTRDLKNIAVRLVIGGQEILSRNGGHIAGDPLIPAVALVNDLPNGVKAGQFITTGTFTGIAFAKTGQTAAVTFADFGTVEAAFV